jgi:DNA-binding transcriptional ArsR family regulator
VSTTATLAPAPATTDQFVEVFGALSEPIRVEILRMMAQRSDDLPCTLLDDVLPIAKSTISYHIQILRRAGLISVRKAGRNYFYELNTDVLRGYSPGFLAHLRRSDAALAA